jgi:hypothetical protein
MPVPTRASLTPAAIRRASLTAAAIRPLRLLRPPHPKRLVPGPYPNVMDAAP